MFKVRRPGGVGALCAGCNNNSSIASLHALGDSVSLGGEKCHGCESHTRSVHSCLTQQAPRRCRCFCGLTHGRRLRPLVLLGAWTFWCWQVRVLGIETCEPAFGTQAEAGVFVSLVDVEVGISVWASLVMATNSLAFFAVDANEVPQFACVLCPFPHLTSIRETMRDRRIEMNSKCVGRECTNNGMWSSATMSGRKCDLFELLPCRCCYVQPARTCGRQSGQRSARTSD